MGVSPQGLAVMVELFPVGLNDEGLGNEGAAELCRKSRRNRAWTARTVRPGNSSVTSSQDLPARSCRQLRVLEGGGEEWLILPQQCYIEGGKHLLLYCCRYANCVDRIWNFGGRW